MSVWEIEQLVPEMAVPFEEAIAKAPLDLSLWIKYFQAMASSSMEIKIFILNRAVTQFPRCYKFWIVYIDLLIEENVAPSCVIDVFKQSLQLLDSAPILWVKYLTYLVHHQKHQITHIRRTFNDALYHLPITQHHMIWPLYISLADEIGGKFGAITYMKYYQYSTEFELKGGGSITIDMIIQKLFEFGDIENGSNLIQSVTSNINEYLTLPKSPVELWEEFIDLLIDSKKKTVNQDFDNFVEKLVQQGIQKYPDQIGKLYSKLIFYYINRKNFDQVRFHSYKGLQECKTLKDFTLLFDIYTEFEQSLVIKLEEQLESNPSDTLSKKFEYRIALLEKFIDDRELMINDMKLRQDPNNLDEWLIRVDLFNDTKQKLSAYVKALTTVNPLKAISLSNSATFADLWIKYANVYTSSNDFKTGALIFSKAVKSQFKTPDELAQIYISWSEILLEDGKESESVTTVEDILFSNDSDINYMDTSLTVQLRIHKSVKLWLFYLDLLESLIDEDQDNSKTIDKITKAYEQMITLKIVTPRILLNYALFLQEQKYWEKSFSVYELSLRLFSDDKVRFEIWNTYLTRIISYRNNTKSIPVERIRDLFDQCFSQGLPANLNKPICILYSQFEEDQGSIMKSIKVIEDWLLSMTEFNQGSIKGDQNFNISIKLEMYQLLISKLALIQDDTRSRDLYTKMLNDKQFKLAQLITVTLDFVKFEISRNQFNRVRSLFKFITKLGNPEMESIKNVWNQWEKFELEYGNELTFKEMLRYKRVIVKDFENDVVIKESINPMGFVKSKNAITPTENAENPDAIDLDMDM